MPFGSSEARKQPTKPGTTLMFGRAQLCEAPDQVRGGEETGRARSLLRSGGHSRHKTPDPIPNSADKCAYANGTASQDVGE